MSPLKFEDVHKVVTLIGPELDTSKTTVFSTFRDEMYFCSAFFAHYRDLGVEQFIIIDDRSQDGTTDFLDAQPDCIRVDAQYRYGDEIRFVDPKGRKKTLRAGIYFKGAIPRYFMPDRFVTYVDADEFLIPPPQAPNLPAIEAALTASRAPAAVASLVEFFPETLSQVDSPKPPAGIDDLLSASPFFEALPLIELTPGARKPSFVNQSKSVCMMEAFGLLPAPEAPPSTLQKLSRKLFGKSKSPDFFQSPRHKTPIVRHGPDTYMVGTHNINKAPSSDILLTLGHFVFTQQFQGKIARAIDWGSHVHGASKYHYYARLIQALEQSHGTLIGSDTQRYTSPQQFLDCGLMKWPVT